MKLAQSQFSSQRIMVEDMFDDKFVMIHDIDLLQMSVEAVGPQDCVSYLLPDTDVPLSDEDTGVMNRLGEPELEHLEWNDKLTHYDK